MGLIDPKYDEELMATPAPAPIVSLPATPEVAPVASAGTTPAPRIDSPSALQIMGRGVTESFGVGQGPEWDSKSTIEKIAAVGAHTGGAALRMVRDLPKGIATGMASVGLTALQPVVNIARGKPFDARSMESDPVTRLPWLGEVPTLYQKAKQAEDSGMGPMAATVFSGAGTFLDSAMFVSIGEALANTFRPRGNLTVPGAVTNTKPIQSAIEADGARVASPSSAEYYTMRPNDAKKFGGSVLQPNAVKWKFEPGADGNMSLNIVKSLPKNTEIGSYVKTPMGLKKVEQGAFGPEVRVYSTEVKGAAKEAAAPIQPAANGKPIFMIPKERVGLSDRPVTPAQIDTITQIGKAKDMDPYLRDSVIRSLTGKESIGALTEKEFAQVAQSLSKYGEKYGVPDLAPGMNGIARNWLQPARHYFDWVEDTKGLPLKSQVYTPIEQAQRLSRSLSESLTPEFESIFGKYAGAKFVEHRRLIDAHARGEVSAITNNTVLTAAEKSELAEISKNLTKWYDDHGEMLNVGREAYLKGYGGPKIENLSGVFPQYKDLNTFSEKQFFAKFKREGSLVPFIDDPLAAGQIYIKEGSRALHFGPALENFKQLYKSLPPEYGRMANSYVQEKMGRLGAMEKFVDSFVPSLNKRMGLNLPMDISRQGISWAMSSMYSGFVGTPKAVFQQSFQLPLFTYSRLGTKHAGEAFMKSFSKAERDRIAKGGWLNDISLPYGSELAKDVSAGGRYANMGKRALNSTLRPLTVVDNDVRIKTFLQAEMQWNEALNAFNKGATRWEDLEKALDFGAFSKADRNIMRQALVKGDKDAAFNTYMREILDETSFPYRTASGARMTYGLFGKLGTGLLNYSIESTNVLARWGRMKQWDKIIRFAGNARALDLTLQESFGFNFQNTVYQRPYGIVSPAFSFAGDLYGFLKAAIDNNRQEMNGQWQEVTRTLKAGMPLGITTRNVKSFWKSIEAGPDENGQFVVYDDKGKQTRSTDFTDLFWGSLMGFPTVEKMEERSAYTDIMNRNEEVKQVREQLGQLIREGKYDEMNSLIEKTGIFPSQSAMESMYVPRLQRAFEQSPAQVKAEFAPRVFPDTVQ